MCVLPSMGSDMRTTECLMLWIVSQLVQKRWSRKDDLVTSKWHHGTHTLFFEEIILLLFEQKLEVKHRNTGQQSTWKNTKVKRDWATLVAKPFSSLGPPCKKPGKTARMNLTGSLGFPWPYNTVSGDHKPVISFSRLEMCLLFPE